MSTCKDCRWWTGSGNAAMGRCDGTHVRTGFVVVSENPYRVGVDLDAVMVDKSAPVLATGRDFGCIHFEVKR